MQAVLRELAEKEAHQIYKTGIIRDFPADEIKPWNRICQAMRAGIYRCLGLFEEEALRGYAFFVFNGKTALLDYFAILPEYRARGWGSCFLRMLSEWLTPYTCVLVEADDPDGTEDADELRIRKRRIRFYLGNGLIDTDVRAEVFGVCFVILRFPSGTVLTAGTVRESYAALYRCLLPDELYQKQVKIKR